MKANGILKQNGLWLVICELWRVIFERGNACLGLNFGGIRNWHGGLWFEFGRTERLNGILTASGILLLRRFIVLDHGLMGESLIA